MTRIPGDIIPAVVDEAEHAPPAFRRRLAACVSVAAHPFVLIPALVAVVGAWTDHDVSVREQRTEMYPAALPVSSS